MLYIHSLVTSGSICSQIKRQASYLFYRVRFEQVLDSRSLSSKKENKYRAKVQTTLLQFFPNVKMQLLLRLDLIYNVLYYKAEGIYNQIYCISLYCSKYISVRTEATTHSTL